MPLLGGHFVERRIAGDAGVRHDHIDRAQIGLDLGNACSALGVVGDIPFVRFDAGFFGESGSGLIVAGIGGGDGIACVFQRL